jgi:hypothetical protein
MSLPSGIEFASTSACSSPKESREAAVAAISRADCATLGTATHCTTDGVRVAADLAFAAMIETCGAQEFGPW